MKEPLFKQEQEDHDTNRSKQHMLDLIVGILGKLSVVCELVAPVWYGAHLRCASLAWQRSKKPAKNPKKVPQRWLID